MIDYRDKQDFPDRHVIRLRGPWELEGVPNIATVAKQIVQMPTRLAELVDGREGAIRLTRRLGCPSGLDEDCRVALVIENLAATGRLYWNQPNFEESLQIEGNFRLDVSHDLRQRNTLTLQFDVADLSNALRASEKVKGGEPPATIGDVRLEIEE